LFWNFKIKARFADIKVEIPAMKHSSGPQKTARSAENRTVCRKKNAPKKTA
jgi:hypothetical protein